MAELEAKRPGGGLQLRTRRAGARWTPAAEKRFLSELARTCNVTASARTARIPRSMVYDRRRDRPEFATQMDTAIAAARASLEMIAIDRAINGVRQPVFYQGRRVGVATTYDNRLLQYLLSRHAPAAARAEAASAMDPADAAVLEAMEARLAEIGERLGEEN